MTTYLGIDPGLASTGWGAVRRDGRTLRYLGCGVLRTTPRTGDLETRIDHLVAHVGELVERFRPDCLVVERWRHQVGREGVNPRTIQQMAALVESLRRWALCQGLTVRLWREVDAKAAVGAPTRGGATKSAVRLRVVRILGLAHAPPQDHASDALALAIGQAWASR